MTRLLVLSAWLAFVSASSISAQEKQNAGWSATKKSDGPLIQRGVPAWARPVVKIWVRCNGKTFSGTGVVITPTGKILTAAHVGRDCTEDRDRSTEKPGTTWTVGPVTTVYAVPEELWPAKLVKRDSDSLGNPTTHDLALLQLQNVTNQALSVAVVAQEWPIPGDELRVVGFSDLPFAFLSNPAPLAGLTVHTTHLMSAWANASGAPQRLHYGGGGLSGLSGGPVFNSKGELVGIHSARATQNIESVFNENCTPSPTDKCLGNALSFPVPQAASATGTKMQTINVDVSALKGVLENYGWATGIARVPPDWFE